jgi:hypothetical protein
MATRKRQTQWWDNEDVDRVIHEHLWADRGKRPSKWWEAINEAANDLASTSIQRHRIEDDERPIVEKLAMIALLDQLSAELGGRTRTMAESAKDAGATWVQIGYATGRSAAMAQAHFSERARELRRAAQARHRQSRSPNES